MLVINRLTEPGGIKRLEIKKDTVLVQIRQGREIVYRAVQAPDFQTHVEKCRQEAGI